jgi:hypothetical protein
MNWGLVKKQAWQIQGSRSGLWGEQDKEPRTCCELGKALSSLNGPKLIRSLFSLAAFRNAILASALVGAAEAASKDSMRGSDDGSCSEQKTASWACPTTSIKGDAVMDAEQCISKTPVRCFGTLHDTVTCPGKRATALSQAPRAIGVSMSLREWSTTRTRGGLAAVHPHSAAACRPIHTHCTLGLSAAMPSFQLRGLPNCTPARRKRKSQWDAPAADPWQPATLLG